MTDIGLAPGSLELPTSSLWETRSDLLSYGALMMAVRAGFEPASRFPGWLISSELISASHPPHHILFSNKKIWVLSIYVIAVEIQA